ncbi:hypothetical protein [Brevibacillus sp. BC25]|uniref:hypothetical protein n=1 Tax=Brevibacillus sp. BC25 TaxID=1144308 RepID=UPI0002710ADB|nr:hypothetical protein [Brevibacillus sp. BC25]EJL31422.1 hypothetical protein PMI05_00785 [Brevibacillus sp. BC25]
MGHTFGIFSKSVGNVTFGKMRSSLVEGAFHPNHPDNPDSPNRPRAEDRYAGYQNPLLGDPGKGQIGRWQTVNLDSLESMIDQMIEQFVRDKNWYAKVRCREALWNMYRRLEWWVNQQIDPQKNDYQRALLMVRDCIYKILKNAEQPDGTHQNVSLPVCPASYYHHFSGYYLNHYDAIDKEVPTFDMRTLPLSDKFHGLFRYVSSTEDQEWKMVHSVGTNEMAGNENIMKLDVTTLKHGNSSKVTFQWRFKKQGFIRFKYMASSAPGDGLLFFINNNQVGGEWNQSNSWQEAKFNVKPGQTYKFDWFVRRMSDRRFGQNAVYVKDVECVEVVQSLDEQTPPDVDTLGNKAFADPKWQWLTRSSKSIMTTYYNGEVTEDINGREVSISLDNECDGVFSWSHKMGRVTPPYQFDVNTFFDDTFQQNVMHGSGLHGSHASSHHGPPWSLDPYEHYSETKSGDANITYSVHVGDETTVDVKGEVEIICPPLSIDHYNPQVISDLDADTTYFTFSGVNVWKRWSHPDFNMQALVMEDPIRQGIGDASTTVTLFDDGWFEFDYACDFRPSEILEVLVDGEQVLVSASTTEIQSAKINLTKGTHTITFRVTDSYTEEPFRAEKDTDFDYDDDSEKIRGRFGSFISVDRSNDWDYNRSKKMATTAENRAEIDYQVKLNPGASLNFTEKVLLEPAIDLTDFDPDRSKYVRVFSEDFNSGDERWSRDIDVRDNWKWVDIYQLYHPESNTGDIDDGVLMVKDQDGTTNRVYLRDIELKNPGFVRFEYGGKYSRYESLKLYDNGKLIWEGNENHESAVGLYREVALPAGKHSLKWVYEDLEEVEVEVGSGSGSGGSGSGGIDGSEELTPEEGGQKCYKAGIKNHDIDYSLYDSGLPSSITGRMFYKGHEQSKNGGIVTREVTAPSFASYTYSEKLKVFGGTGIPNNTPSKTYLDYSGLKLDSNLKIINGYPVLFTDSIVPGNTVEHVISFSGGGIITLRFNFASLVRDLNKKNKSKLGKEYTGTRASFRMILSAKSEGGGEVIFDSVKNEGSSLSYANIDWSKSLFVTKKANSGNEMDVKKWYLRLIFKDEYSDNDQVDSNLQFAAINNLVITTTKRDNEGKDIYDTTEVKMEVIDKSTGKSIGKPYPAYFNGVSSYNKAEREHPIQVIIPPGKTYQIRYTLVKGPGTKGGLHGNGGSFRLSEGKFKETWEDYCHDSNGHYYPKKETPYTGTPPTQPATEWVIPPDSWCWLDAIEVWESPDPVRLCKDTRLRVRVYDEDSDDLISEDEYDGDDEQLIEVALNNNTPEAKRYRVNYRFLTKCDDMVSLSDAHVQLEDVKPLEKSSCTVIGFKVTENTAIWMGGCNGSKMHLNVYGQNGALIHSQTFLEEGKQSFGLASLLPTPSPSYRFEFITEQKGTTSAVTGKEYKTTFRMKDFQATETWELIPEPFNSKLEFYIDNVLMDTFTQQGGFFDHYYPVEAGKHTYKWKFIAQSSGQVWDGCEVDYIKLTNWICDKVLVTPYCDPGSGDKCVEALIKCLLAIWKQRPEACVIGKRIWLFT